MGRRTQHLDANAFQALRQGRRNLLLDLGTGDGKHVLHEARRRPDTLVVGLDAAPDAMRPTAASAARKPSRGGVPNAVFVWAAVEKLPVGLTGVTEVHALMPWGSLLRAFVRPDHDVLAEIAGHCTTSARFLITVNLHAWRPRVPEVGDTPEPTPESALAALAPAFALSGWTIQNADYPDAAALADLGTSWTKRLGSSRTDLAVLALRGTIG